MQRRKKLSESHKNKIGLAFRGKTWEERYGAERAKRLRENLCNLRKEEKNRMWRGDAVGYSAVHNYIRRRLPKPDHCTKCMKITPRLDLANISQKYTRELNDWEWICRRCHMLGDGRMKNLDNTGRKFPNVKKKDTTIVCKECHELKKHKAKGMCLSCYGKHRYYSGITGMEG